MSSTLVNPSWLLPTEPLRFINQDKVGSYISLIRQGNALEPALCAEFDGGIFIVNGHHRWTAHVLANDTAPIAITVIGEEELKSLYGQTGEDFAGSSRLVNIIDWEEVLDIPLIKDFPTAPPTSMTVLIVGPSGAGKSTVIRELLSSGSSYSFIVSTTERQMRDYETGGKEYEFVSEIEFLRGVRKHEYAEWQFVHGKRYGAKKIRLFADTSKCCITDIDAYGALLLKRLFPNDIVTIFLDVSPEVSLRKRIEGRSTETNSELLIRLARTKRERAMKRLFDFTIVGSSIKGTAEEIDGIVRHRSIQYHIDDEYWSSNRTLCEINIFDGDQQLHWNNCSDLVIPSLFLESQSYVADGFRCLERMIFDQIVSETNRLDRKKSLGRQIFSHCSRIAPVKQGHENSSNLRTYKKDVRLDGLISPICDEQGMFVLR